MSVKFKFKILSPTLNDQFPCLPTATCQAVCSASGSAEPFVFGK